MGWLIALGILVLLAILPLGATIRYDAEGLIVKVIVGLLHIPLQPKLERDKEPKAKKTQKETTKTAAKPQQTAEPRKEAGGSWKDFLPLIQTGLSALNDLRRKLRINRLELKLIMAGDDPCDLAVNYGRANAALGSLWPQLERCFVIRKRDVQIQCDFEATEMVVIARADVTITLGRLVALLARYGVRAIKQYFKLKKSREGGASK